MLDRDFWRLPFRMEDRDGAVEKLDAFVLMVGGIRVHQCRCQFDKAKAEAFVEMLGFEFVGGGGGRYKGFRGSVVESTPVGEAKNGGNFIVPQDEVVGGFVGKDWEAGGGRSPFCTDLALVEEGGFCDGSLSCHGGRERCDESIVLQE